jgi:hypothetical protein
MVAVMNLGPNVGTTRLAAAIVRAITTGAQPQSDWPDHVKDALDDLEKALIAAEENRSADAALNIRLALASLAGIWHDEDARDQIYLGEEGS